MAIQGGSSSDRVGASGPDRRLLRIGEVAKLLAISSRSVWRLISIGALPPVRLGRATRIPAEAVEDLIERGGA